jgi:O-6-methylguanine DNA methyltransferase
MIPNSVTTLSVQTSHGTFAAHYSEHGLAALDFPKSREPKASQDTISKTVRQWHTLTTRAVQSVLGGKTAAELPPLDLSSGTEFQRKVWDELLWTPCGETRSYGEIAQAIRKPKAIRAVGGACGANPIPLLIPCHRVLAANRKIGGFSGGLEWKQKLLSIERVKLNA